MAIFSINHNFAPSNEVMGNNIYTGQQRILIVRFRQMGDTILATCLFSTLRKTFPDATIDLILNERIAPLFQGHPALSNIITFSEKERHAPLVYLRKIWHIMRQGHYTIVIDMRSTINTLPFALFSGALFRLGTKKWYNRWIHNYRYQGRRESMIDHNLHLIDPLNAIRPLQYVRTISLSITEEEKTVFRQYLLNKGIDFSRPVVVVGVTAKCEDKRWPEDKMAALIDLFVGRYPRAQVIFNYAPGEEERLARNIFARLSSRQSVRLDIQARSSRELLAMATFTNFYFGNEGGARHIMHAAGVPSFVICAPNCEKTVWLPKDGTPTDGIEAADVVTREQLNTMSRAQQYAVISVEETWKRMDAFINFHLSL